MLIAMSKKWTCLGLSIAIVLSTGAMTVEAKSNDKADRQFESISRILEKADQMREKGDTEEAGKLYGATIAAYQEFHRNFPDEWVELIQFRVAYCRNQLMNLLAAKRAAEIKEDAADAKQENPLDEKLAAALSESIALCRNGRYDEAEAAMQSLIETNPNCSPAYLILGTACVGKGNLGMATTLLQRAVALDTSNHEAHYNLAQLLIRAKEPNFDDARAHYRQAVLHGAEPDSDLEAVLGL